MTVEAILEGAARVFVADGFDGASTNRIAKAAGVSIGSLYQYFPNKEALAAELIERHLEEMLGILTEELADMADRSPREVVQTAVQAMFDMAFHRPELARVLFQAGPRVGMGDRRRALFRRFQRLLEAYMHANRTGANRVRRPELAAWMLVYAVDGIMHEASQVAPPDGNDALIEEVTDMCLAYLFGEAA